MKKLFAAARLLLTLRCEQSAHLVSDSLDRELSNVEWWAVRLHHISCRSCRRFAKQLRMLREGMRFNAAGGDEPSLSAAARQRIHDAIHRAE